MINEQTFTFYQKSHDTGRNVEPPTHVEFEVIIPQDVILDFESELARHMTVPKANRSEFEIEAMDVEPFFDEYYGKLFNNGQPFPREQMDPRYPVTQDTPYAIFVINPSLKRMLEQYRLRPEAQIAKPPPPKPAGLVTPPNFPNPFEEAYTYRYGMRLLMYVHVHF